VNLRLIRPVLAALVLAAMVAPWRDDGASNGAFSGISAWAEDSIRTSPDSAASAARDPALLRGDRTDTTAIERAAAALTSVAERATPETVMVTRDVSVPVFLGGREVFLVRSERDGLTVPERAAAIRARLTAAVAKRNLPADSVRLISTPQGIEVRLGDQFLWLVTPSDIEQTDAAALATEIAELPARVREGVLRERAGRRPIGVLISIALAVAITLAAALFGWGLIALNRRWRRWLGGTLPRHLRAIRLRGFEVLSRNQLVGLVGGLLGRLDLVAGLLLFYVYVTLVLSLFPWTQGWSWHLFDFAARGLLDVLRRLVSALPNLFVVVVIILAFRWLTRLSDRFFAAIAAGTLTVVGFHPELAIPSRRIVRILLWIVAAMVAYPYVPGAQSRAVQGVSLLIGVMVSLGSTSFIGNIISGIVLTYTRSYRVGDRVQIKEHVGDVTSLGFFATKIRTLRNEEVTLPNGLVAAGTITNYTRLAEEHGLILHTEVTIGYDVDWRRVHGLLSEAAGRVKGIEAEPKPTVFQRSLNDFHITYELNCVTRRSHEQLGLYSELHAEIQDAFARAGVEIMSPGVHTVRRAAAAILPKPAAASRSTEASRGRAPSVES
jgi:small-conductance mechanosensitive channel